MKCNSSGSTHQPDEPKRKYHHMIIVTTIFELLRIHSLQLAVCHHCGKSRNTELIWMPDQVRHDSDIRRRGSFMVSLRIRI